MQKKLIALAIASLGLSGAAFADTAAVTIYGVADATVDMMNVGDGKAATGNQGLGSYQRVSTNSSLIGFKGAESIGNGLTAVFQYESGVGFDNQGALSASRDSYVGVAGGFGTVAIGNLTGPSRALGASVDVNSGATGIGYNGALLGKLGTGAFSLTTGGAALAPGGLLTGRLDTTIATNGPTDQVNARSMCGINSSNAASASSRSQTCTSAFDSRFANAIAYISPNMGGVTVIFGYVPNENKTASGQPNTSAYDLGATYANGPISAGVTHSEVQTKNADEVKPSLTRVAGSYDFGAAKVRALWEQTKLTTGSAGTASANLHGLDLKQTVWGVGVTAPVGSGTILAQYYTAGNTKAGSTDLTDSGANLMEVGYEYSLSKRTMVKALYSKLDNKNNAAYDFGVNSVGDVKAGASISGVSVGVRHTF